MFHLGEYSILILMACIFVPLFFWPIIPEGEERPPWKPKKEAPDADSDRTIRRLGHADDEIAPRPTNHTRSR